MITKFSVQNYKSIDKLDLALGRVNVLIGENGAGKSNILESIALAGAASAEKLDNEFLASRGIRVTPPEYMRPAFGKCSALASINIAAETATSKITWSLSNDNEPYSKWTASTIQYKNAPLDSESFNEYLKSIFEKSVEDGEHELFIQSMEKLLTSMNHVIDDYKSGKNTQPSFQIKVNKSEDKFISAIFKHGTENPTIDLLSKFVIYSPENSALRTFSREGQIEPLGINGEGILKLLSVMSADEKYKAVMDEIISLLKILGWFKCFEIVSEKTATRIAIEDKYIDKTRKYFDQHSTNEGFLFLLFYFLLFSSELTPKFFAIDNIDASLNPKLCQKLMKMLIDLAIKNDKQVILTTHNPAILDGLNLDDDNQRLFVVSRNRKGCTRIERIRKAESEKPIRLSEAFLRGSLGGLPGGF